jgi:hypothetical protein
MSEQVEKSDDQHRGRDNPYLRSMIELTRKLQTVRMPCVCGRRASVISTRHAGLLVRCTVCAAARGR